MERPPEPEFFAKEKNAENMEGTLLGQGSKQSSMESCFESHSASILFHIHQSFSFT